MAVNTKIYQGDIGIIFNVDCGVDISAGTTFQIIIKKPDGSTATWTGTLSGTDFIKYTTQAGDLSLAGDYIANAKVIGGSFTFTGAGFTFSVVPSGKIY